MKQQYDVIIIGSGSVGTPTAYFCAREGLRVLVVDELASSGQGQNKAAIGGVRATHSHPAKIQICLESLKIFSTWKEVIGTDIGWKEGGYCFPVYRDEEEDLLKSILPIQKQYGLDIDWVDDAGIARVVPGINSKGLYGGTFSPRDGQVSPLLCSESFTNEAMKYHARFCFNESVTDVITEGESGDCMVTAVKTEKNVYYADAVVNAAGAHASEICRMVNLDVPVDPNSHEAGISAPVKPFLGPLVVDLRPGLEGRTANFYFGQNTEGQILFCYTPEPIIPGVDRECTSVFMPVMARRLVDLIPRFKHLIIRRLWRGLYPMTPDGVAVVGESSLVKGFYLGVGMCGQGLMMGPGVGKNLSSLIARGRPCISKEVFDLLCAERNFYHPEKEKLT
ncbi:MAG: FAD-binding oxidoreductase [Thermoplasmatota archaeon]